MMGLFMELGPMMAEKQQQQNQKSALTAVNKHITYLFQYMFTYFYTTEATTWRPDKPICWDEHCLF